MNHALSSPFTVRSGSATVSLDVNARTSAFLRFPTLSHTKFTPAHTSIPTWNTKNVIVALVNRGAGDSVPSSHVERMPPEFVMVVRNASAVARRTCGAALFAIHALRGGAVQYVPGRSRKSAPYRTWLSLEPV